MSVTKSTYQNQNMRSVAMDALAVAAKNAHVAMDGDDKDGADKKDYKPCGAKDPNNCRFHRTGKFAPYKTTNTPSVLKERLEAVSKIGNFTDADGVTHKTRIMKATGKPCSGALNSTINRLLAGDPSVTDAEIEAIPEWRDAQRQMDEFKRKRVEKNEPQYTISIKTPEREKMREEIVAKFLAPSITARFNDAIDPKNGGDGRPYAVHTGKRIDIITGLPAAGKSTTFARRLSLQHRSRLVDSDEIKKMLPEYKDGIGSDCVHEESVDLNVRVLKEAVKRGENVVYPVLGFSANALSDMIDALHQFGYDVNLHLNELETVKAKGRMLQRFVEKNRFIPLQVYAKAGNLPTIAYEKVKGKCDGYDRYRSDTINHSKPTCVESHNQN